MEIMLLSMEVIDGLFLYEEFEVSLENLFGSFFWYKMVFSLFVVVMVFFVFFLW